MTEPESLDPYRTLGCEPTANQDEIRHAYRRLALQHHPDKGGNEETFKKLSTAYQILTTAELKTQYDQDHATVIPEAVLIPPLKVFNDTFRQWLSQYPLIEFIFKDSCGDVIQFLNTHAETPAVKSIIDLLTGTSGTADAKVAGAGTGVGAAHMVDNFLQIANQFTSNWFQNRPTHNNKDEVITLHKKVYVTLDDIYVGSRYPHHFSITNEDLQLPNDYQIINPDVQINIPLQHPALDLDVDLYVINQRHMSSYTQKIKVELDVMIQSLEPTQSPVYYRIGDYDLLMYVDLTLEQLSTLPIITVSYLNHKTLSFRNPLIPAATSATGAVAMSSSVSLRQLYRIDNIALPNRLDRKRGCLYIFFNLLLSTEQMHSVVVSPSESPHLYKLKPVGTHLLFQTG